MVPLLAMLSMETSQIMHMPASTTSSKVRLEQAQFS